MGVKNILNFLTVFFLFALQFSFILGLPTPLNKINLVLIFFVFLFAFFDFERCLWRALIIGFLFDLFSPLPFGINMFSLFFSIVIVHFLQENFFTNRSLYSFLAMTALISVFYDSCVNFLFHLFVFFSGGDYNFLGLNFLKSMTMGTIGNVVVSFFVFYAINLIGNNLKPVFLGKRVSHKKNG